MLEQTANNPITAQSEVFIADPTAATASAYAADQAILDGGVREIEGTRYRELSDGSLKPESLVRAQDLLEDETVRRIMSFAVPLAAQTARFKDHTLGDIADFMAVMRQEYKATPGGTKGNVTLHSLDGLLKVQLRVADRLTFGPELQAAKDLVDAFLAEETANVSDVLKGLVMHAFRADQEGLVNRAELFRLLRHDIEDARWQEAMRAIKDSIRPIGSKEYVRFYRRATIASAWEPVVIDLASA